MREKNSIKPYSNFWESSKGAFFGFVDALRMEKKIRQVAIALTVAVVLCMIADIGYFQILIVILSWLMALICEIFNTAIEKALDHSSGREFHPLVKQGKDYASACTFITITFAVVLTLILIFGRHFGKEKPTKAFEIVFLMKGDSDLSLVLDGHFLC